MDDSGWMLYLPIDKPLLDLMKLSIAEPKRRSFEFMKGSQSIDVPKVETIAISIK